MGLFTMFKNKIGEMNDRRIQSFLNDGETIQSKFQLKLDQIILTEKRILVMSGTNCTTIPFSKISDVSVSMFKIKITVGSKTHEFESMDSKYLKQLSNQISSMMA